VKKHKFWSIAMWLGVAVNLLPVACGVGIDAMDIWSLLSATVCGVIAIYETNEWRKSK
jgi:putative Mn2+ efflux pump MntP